MIKAYSQILNAISLLGIMVVPVASILFALRIYDNPDWLRVWALAFGLCFGAGFLEWATVTDKYDRRF